MTFEQYKKSSEEIIAAFGKWKPDDSLRIISFVGRVDGSGGYILMESDDPKSVASFAAKFNAWSESDIVPVIDIGEAVEVGNAAAAWASDALT